MRALSVLCLLLLTCGCSTYSLQELKNTAPRGTPFQAALATRYLHYSETKAAKYNWVDSGYFADKGLNAAYGHDVAPESPDDWALTADAREMLVAARAALTEALKANAEAHPEDAAAAQVFYDCWVQNQSAGWQALEIAYCRDNFGQALEKLATPPATEAEATASTPPPDAEEAKNQDYIVFFGTNQDSLDDSAGRTVDSVAAEIKKLPGSVSITVNGHTDTVGGKRYNFDLSRRRAQNVLKALATQGIPEKSIHAFGFGDTDLKVQTGPNVPEPKNRRVEIYIGDD